MGSLVAQGRDGSGLDYRRNRYYDPETGGFTQEDPIGLAGGANLYGFAGGDPVNFSDPFGLCADEDWKCKLVKALYEVTGAVVGGAAGFAGGAAAGTACGPLVEICSPVMAVAGPSHWVGRQQQRQVRPLTPTSTVSTRWPALAGAAGATRTPIAMLTG
jgi:RHS repeat-associated protein